MQVSSTARALLEDTGLLPGPHKPRPPGLPSIHSRRRAPAAAAHSPKRKVGPLAGKPGTLGDAGQPLPAVADHPKTVVGDGFAARLEAMEREGRGYRCGQSWVPEAYMVRGHDPIVQHEKRKNGASYDFDTGGWVYKKFPPETPTGDRVELLWLANTLDALVEQKDLSLDGIRGRLNAAADGSLGEGDAHRALDKLAERFALLDLGLHELHRTCTVQNASLGFFMNEFRRETAELFRVLVDTARNAALSARATVEELAQTQQQLLLAKGPWEGAPVPRAGFPGASPPDAPLSPSGMLDSVRSDLTLAPSSASSVGSTSRRAAKGGMRAQGRQTPTHQGVRRTASLRTPKSGPQHRRRTGSRGRSGSSNAASREQTPVPRGANAKGGDAIAAAHASVAHAQRLCDDRAADDVSVYERYGAAGDDVQGTGGEFAGYSEAHIRARRGAPYHVEKKPAIAKLRGGVTVDCGAYQEDVCPVTLPAPTELKEWTQGPEGSETALHRRLDVVFGRTQATLDFQTPTAEEIAQRAVLIRSGAVPPAAAASPVLTNALPAVAPFTDPPTDVGNLETASPGLRPALPSCRHCGQAFQTAFPSRRETRAAESAQPASPPAHERRRQVLFS
eukprot:TRINITY_DN30062_c0_g1_i1.p1 TRINITY_DN30062_c0_g1~~TRINITY_DN30062_c0_g1_i1.p1  ORF type:complete len:619 (+),score=150.98 TRINITY_DN30062_c0_g1_i1:39-1895(+)